MDKLDRWADDRKNSLELLLKDLKAKTGVAGRNARLASDLQSKVAFQREKKDLEAERRRKQLELNEAEDLIDAQKETLLSEVEGRLKQTVTTTELFTIAWEVV
jgi:hypothetical protein